MQRTAPIRLNVACGSYDGSVFAMSYDHEGVSEGGPTRLKAEFIDPDAHPSPVTSLAIGGNIVVSGSADEAIQIFSLTKRSRMGCLEVHTGSIRQLVFADSRHLMSAGEDACLAVWRRSGGASGNASAWQCIRQMRRHKAPITSLALHSSNRAAFTLSAEDKTLRVWNLTRGRQAFTSRLKALSAEGAVGVTVSRRFMMLHWPYDRIDVVDLVSGGCTGKPLLSCKFPKSFSVPPVIFYENEHYLYLLVGFGNILKALRCPLPSAGTTGTTLSLSKLESLGEICLPGKRLKFLRALPWPQELVVAHPEVYGGCRHLITLVTTDADGSYVRGYAVDLETGESSPCLSSPRAVRAVFTYDIKEIRLTQVDAAWQTTETDDKSLFSESSVNFDSGGDGKEEESDEEDENEEIDAEDDDASEE